MVFPAFLTTMPNVTAPTPDSLYSKYILAIILDRANDHDYLLAAEQCEDSFVAHRSWNEASTRSLIMNTRLTWFWKPSEQGVTARIDKQIDSATRTNPEEPPVDHVKSFPPQIKGALSKNYPSCDINVQLPIKKPQKHCRAISSFLGRIFR